MDTHTLILAEAGADVTWVLAVDGDDLLTTIHNGNVQSFLGTTVDLKAKYNLVNVNIMNTYSSSVTLDASGICKVSALLSTWFLCSARACLLHVYVVRAKFVLISCV